MEDLADEMKREDLRTKLWSAVSGWDVGMLVDDLFKFLPIYIVEEYVEEVTNRPQDKLTPREAHYEGHQRAELLQKINDMVGEEMLDMDLEKFVKELSLECKLPALREFTNHLANLGCETCKTWRPKLVMINVKKEEGKFNVYGYFKAEIDVDELESCHKAWLRQKDFDYEVNIPESAHWKLSRNLEERADAVSKNAGWVRYLIGELQ